LDNFHNSFARESHESARIRIKTFGNNILDTPSEQSVESIFTPFRLVSLLDMLKIYAEPFLNIISWLSVVRHSAEILSQIPKSDFMLTEIGQNFYSDDSIQSKLNGLDLIIGKCKDIKLDLSVLWAERIQAGIKNNGLDLAKWSSDLEHLEHRIIDELQSKTMLILSAREQEYYETDIFNQKVLQSFPSSNFDIAEAGKCFALARYTACSFHLMRSIETPLNLLGKKLGLSDVANWNKRLQDIEKRFKDIRDQSVPKPSDWQSNLEPFYSEASALLRNIKNAWRNNTMHLEHKHTEEEAMRLFNAVKGFMEFLAEHLSEDITE
jgi:hypothetical protein